jgi:hypothetical protein
MRRHFVREKEKRSDDRKKLQQIRAEVLKNVAGTAVASDQFCRLFDLAIDFAEDVEPLSKKSIARIVDIFQKH